MNQKQTFKHERQGEFLWAPKRNADGGRSPYYDFMQKIEPGDLIFSFVGSRIISISMAREKAITAPKPDFGSAGLNWQNEGWYVSVDYVDLPRPVKPKDHIQQIASHLSEKYSPLTQSGRGNQAYFFPVGIGLLNELRIILGGQFESAVEQLIEQRTGLESAPNSDDPDAISQEMAIQRRTDIGETQRQQLVFARRGQGLYRTQVRLIEKACRVTGLVESRHLIASHIKPWSKSNDAEKLDGSNGLLLSPHIDHLFDKGFITFSNEGALKVSRNLQDQVLTKWHLQKNQHVGTFSREQSKYLEYHRDMIFERTSGQAK